MAAHTNDEAFHEIQLNGKQLVFLFMSATVVSVVIFLLGVLVGRNVRVQRTAIAQAEALTQSPAPDLAAAVSLPPQPAADPTVAPPPPTVDDAAAAKPVDPQEAEAEAEALRPAAPRKVPGPTSTSGVSPQPEAAPRIAANEANPERVKESKAAVAKAPAPKAAAETTKTDAAPLAGSGFAVQVAALNVRGEADAIAKRLAAKGYAAYVQMPTSGTPNVYRVRVGTFKTRREAESVASKLQKEEKYKPWVTR